MADLLLVFVAAGAASALLLILGPWIVRMYRAARARRLRTRIVPGARHSLAYAVGYPMYVMPVRTLLNDMSSFAPHQDLLAQGKLVQATPDMAGRIIFVSRQA